MFFGPVRRQFPFICAFALIGWLYVWTVLSNNLSLHFGERQSDYYNRLVHGFLQGQLSLDAQVAPELLRVANPYDPAQRPSGVPVLHDASLFRGRYYIYYGVVPAVVALLPFRLVTGIDLPLAFAIVGFALLTYGIALWLLADIRTRLFPRCGSVMTFLIAGTLGLASCAPLLLRRSSMYELPITCGGACAMAGIACLYLALVRGASPKWCVAAASLAIGLAIGSRPTYILTPFVFFAVVWWMLKGRAATPFGAAASTGRRGADSALYLLAAVVPMGVVGLLLAWYNYARFGSPTEFGVSYILSGVYESKIEHFRARYLGWNAFAYFLAPGEWGRYFPFFHPRPVGLNRPYQHYGMDHAFGLLANVPLVWFAVFAFRRRTRDMAGFPEGWRVWAIGTLATAVGVCLVVLSFYAAMARYLGDFAPALSLLGAIGALALVDCSAVRRPGVRRTQRIATAALCGATAFIVFFASVQIYGRLRTFNPTAYERLARLANAPVQAIESLRGAPRGSVELTLEFANPIVPGRREELVRTGWSTDKDRLLVEYVDANHARFVFEHAGAPAVESEVIEATPGVHTVSIALGSLFPPTTWPGYDGWAAAQVHALRRRLSVRFDGQVMLDRYQRFYPASAATLVIGGRGRTQPFSGRIVAEERAPVVMPDRSVSSAPAAVPSSDGAISLLVRFPAGQAGHRDPVLVTGETGRGDFVAVEYLGRDRLRFFVDHWGGGGPFSGVIPYEPGKVYRLSIRHAVFADGTRVAANSASDLLVSLDGREVWRVAVVLYAISPEDIYIGFNPIGGSACGERFTGTIETP